MKSRWLPKLSGWTEMRLGWSPKGSGWTPSGVCIPQLGSGWPPWGLGDHLAVWGTPCGQKFATNQKIDPKNPGGSPMLTEWTQIKSGRSPKGLTSSWVWIQPMGSRWPPWGLKDPHVVQALLKRSEMDRNSPMGTTKVYWMNLNEVLGISLGVWVISQELWLSAVCIPTMRSW